MKEVTKFFDMIRMFTALINLTDRQESQTLESNKSRFQSQLFQLVEMRLAIFVNSRDSGLVKYKI